MSRESWNAAFAAADQGRPADLAELVAPLVPTYAAERLKLLIRRGHFGKLGRSPAIEPTELQRRKVKALDFYGRIRARGVDSETAFERIVAADDHDHPDGPEISIKTWSRILTD